MRTLEDEGSLKSLFITTFLAYLAAGLAAELVSLIREKVSSKDEEESEEEHPGRAVIVIGPPEQEECEVEEAEDRARGWEVGVFIRRR